MKKLDQLINECKSHNLNVSITHQKINGVSIEIYKGYLKNYEKIFYSDAYPSSKKAIKKGLKFLRKNYD